MRLLLDTHIFIWAAGDRKRLSSRILALLADAENELLLSTASVWELAIKTASGRLDFPLEDFDMTLADMEIEPIPVSASHALLAGSLPRYHNDPFDRMLVAQAQSEGLTLVTADKELARYGVPILAA